MFTHDLKLKGSNLPVESELQEFSLSASWYIISSFGWSTELPSDTKVFGPLGNNVGVFWHNIFHKLDIQGSRVPSYLQLECKGQVVTLSEKRKRRMEGDY